MVDGLPRVDGNPSALVLDAVNEGRIASTISADRHIVVTRT
jgi:hypothetical protein